MLATESQLFPIRCAEAPPSANIADMRSALPILVFATAAASCTNVPVVENQPSPEPAAAPIIQVLKASEVRWEQLNPARGDQSPQAGTLWGDRKGTVPTGYLIKFEDGFCSPPHIHNVTYRGVVISGLVHNDDPGAARMWMPPGSFWTQPKGEAHITAAQGSGSMAYIEIEEGPYLVLPTVRAFDSGERPVNVDASNLVWLDASTLRSDSPNRAPAPSSGAKVAFLWGAPSSGGFHGAFIKLPSGFDGQLVAKGADFRAIVIEGRPRHQAGAHVETSLERGSYFASLGATSHRVSSADEECVLYIRTNGRFEVAADALEK